MGLFSSSYKTTVGTVVSRLIKDDAMPESIKTGTVKSFFNDGNLTDYIMEELAASVGVRAERMYNYAEDNYVYGLPSGDIYSSTQGRQQVEAVIEAIEGQQVLMEYSNYGPPNALHIGWIKLVAQYGYSQATNQLSVLTAQKGVPVYLKDMVVVVPANQVDSFELGALAQWGTSAASGYTPERLSSVGGMVGLAPPSPVYKSPTATELHLKITCIWKTSANAVPSEETFTISVQDYDVTADYFHAKYSFGTQTKYWIYKNKLGTYPSLDNVFVDGPAVGGTYFPFAYFRYNKQSVISNKTTQAYLTTKKMVKYLGIDFDLMAETIDENPDIADVEQAMLMLGVPAVSTNEIECKYLFDYFNAMHYAMGGTAYPLLSELQAKLGDGSVSKGVSIIKDSQFKMALSNDGIYKRIVAGSIGPIGVHTSSFSSVNVTVEYVSEVTSEVSSTTIPSGTHTYRKQITAGLYEEIQVKNLKMTYYVYEEYTTTADETDNILLIPIDKSISSTYPIPDRETLYARSLHFVFNSRVVTEIQWYQTGIFQVLLIVLAIVITVYTYGADGGSAIATALGLSGAAGLVATIVVNLILGQLLTVGFKLFVKAFGTEVATALAIIALLYGGYELISAGGLQGAPWAEAMLQLSTGLQQAIMQTKMEGLVIDQQNFLEYADEQTKLLDTAKELLESNNALNPLVIFGEEPQAFYNRTVHSGNIGVLGITAISYYVDIALTLPKLKDTLGEATYAASI